mgnify:CR=1 FL=1|jgi:arsenate reductase (thioredoxin)
MEAGDNTRIKSGKSYNLARYQGINLKILFICTHNRCRSIICEAITNHISGGRLEAYSAGSQPAGQVHPLSLKYLQNTGFPTDALKSESWDAYANKNIDVAVTLCDSAAEESCPLWMGDTAKVHWGLSDPSKINGSEAEKESAFINLIEEVSSRIQKLLALDFDNLSSAELELALKKIAESH